MFNAENLAYQFEYAENLAYQFKVMEHLARETELNPDLEEEYVIKFEEWQPSRANSEAFVKTGRFPPVEVTLEGIPQGTNVMLKHYYIYSKTPGFGKSFAMREFCDKYNAHFIKNLNNWTSVPRTAQFLIFDGVTHKKKLNFHRLKLLANGSSVGFFGNCKIHGMRPRKDVQLVMLSNMSMYEVYGQWDSKLQRRFIDSHDLQKLEQRFHVIRLDGDVAEDRRRYSSPCTWTESELIEEIRELFAPIRFGLPKNITSTEGKFIKVLHYINLSKVLVDKWHRGTWKFKASMILFAGLLAESVGSIPGMNISLPETVKCLYSLLGKMKMGKELDSALASLVRRNNDALDLSGEHQSKKRRLGDDSDSY